MSETVPLAPGQLRGAAEFVRPRSPRRRGGGERLGAALGRAGRRRAEPSRCSSRPHHPRAGDQAEISSMIAAELTIVAALLRPQEHYADAEPLVQTPR